MQFGKEQIKVIKNKLNGHKLIQGSRGCGKTTAIINRIPLLLDSYCIDKDDAVLVVCSNEEHLNKLSSIYQNIEIEKYKQSSFFDADNSAKLEMHEIDSLVLYYFNEYKKHHDMNCSMIDDASKAEMLKNALSAVMTYSKAKILTMENLEFIMKEIRWIKECNFTHLDEYQNCDRYSRVNEDSIKLRRKSKARKAIYEVMEVYNNSLRENNLLDEQDAAVMALKQSRRKTSRKFTHIIVDECLELSRVQLEILKAANNCAKNYGSIIFNIDSDKLSSSKGWLNKKVKLTTLGYDMKGRTVNFKNNYAQNEIIAAEKVTAEPSVTIETSKYIDLSRNVCHEFISDSSNIEEVYLADDGFKEKADNLINIPVFNEIAAGSPILMNDEIESNICLPKEWVRSSRDIFMLKIKGDSMVNKNINDGDYVVINKQKYPQVNDIVAAEIEGEATLKTLKIKGKQIILQPENDIYDPIIIREDQEFSILGVAVGLIKDLY